MRWGMSHWYSTARVCIVAIRAAMALRSWPFINNMKKYAVIVAGGAGVRMGGALPKQFLLVHGRPVIWYTLNTFLSAYADLSVILVVPGDYRLAGLEVAASTRGPDRIRMADGGVSRFHSVRNGLELIGEASIVF